MPYLNEMSPTRSQFLKTLVILAQSFLSLVSALPQSKNALLHAKIEEDFSFPHSFLQQAAWRSIDKRYQDAPKTC